MRDCKGPRFQEKTVSQLIRLCGGLRIHSWMGLEDANHMRASIHIHGVLTDTHVRRHTCAHSYHVGSQAKRKAQTRQHNSDAHDKEASTRTLATTNRDHKFSTSTHHTHTHTSMDTHACTGQEQPSKDTKDLTCLPSRQMPREPRLSGGCHKVRGQTAINEHIPDGLHQEEARKAEWVDARPHNPPHMFVYPSTPPKNTHSSTAHAKESRILRRVGGWVGGERGGAAPTTP